MVVRKPPYKKWWLDFQGTDKNNFTCLVPPKKNLKNLNCRFGRKIRKEGGPMELINMGL